MAEEPGLLKVKCEIFERIWAKFEELKPTLILAGIDEKRFMKKEKVENKLTEWHINKLRDSEAWINEFDTLSIGPWKKIRKENSEDYWSRAKLMGMGKEYPEIKRLMEASKKVRDSWFVSRNCLTKPKRAKPEAEPTDGN